MDWVVLSLMAAVGYSAYSLMQKYAFQRYIDHVASFNFWTETCRMLLGITILVIHPLPYGLLSVPVLAVIAATGVMQVIIVLLRAWATHLADEVTRIVPVLDTYPVFVALLAILVLGEELSIGDWSAIALVVVGAFVASSHQALGSRHLERRSAILIAVAASFSMSAFAVTGKLALEYVDVWHITGLSSLLTPFMTLGLVVKTGVWSETMALARRVAPLGFAAGAALSMGLAWITGFGAYAVGPVSLSSAIMGTRPLLIVLYASLVGVWFPRLAIERTWRTGLGAKASAAALVSAGIAMMAVF